jgi:RNA polymerase sigma-70 factor (ECF subfamily)
MEEEQKCLENIDQQVRRFMYLYTANQNRIYGFILTMIPDWSGADDVLQETAGVLWSKFHEFRPGTDFIAWALSIARFEALSYLRKKKRNDKRFSDIAMQNICESAASSVNKDNDRLDALRGCVGKLKATERDLLAMRYESGATIKSIASRLDRSVDTLYKEFRRIHVALLNCIRRQLQHEGLS